MSDWALWERIQSHARCSPEQPAFIEIESGRSISYADVVAFAVRSASGGSHGEPYGESARVMLQSANTIDYPIAFLAHLLNGLAVFPNSPDVPKAELDRATERTGRLAPLPAGEGTVLLCSSGTTGLPKIVRRTRASLDVVARNMADCIGFRPADKVIAAVPLVHSYGMEHGLLAPLWAGSTVLLCDGLNVQQIVAAMKQGATIFPAVPSIIELLSRSIEAPAHQLRRVYSAGSPLPANVACDFARTFGVAVGQVYGMTELGSVLYHDPARDTPGSVGRACVGVSVRVDPQTSEVLIRSESMLADYIGEPLELIDGHLRTGDLGHLTPTGELVLTGRLRLLIDVGGAKVNPLEVELVLMQHPGVAIAVVLPLKLSETVSKVRAIVVPTDPALPPDVAELRAFVKSQLAAYKVPRVIDMRNSLPRSPTGKILRQQLETA